MAVATSFWTRIGSMFRGSDDAASSAGGLVGPDNDSTTHGLMARQPGRRELTERYQRVVELMSALHTHFERQDERSRELGVAVHRVGSQLEQLVESQQSQSEAVRSIAEQVAASADRQARLSETLGMLPGSLDAQAGAVQSLARQFESSQDADHRVANSLGELGQAVDSLRTATNSQIRTLETLHQREQQQRGVLETTLVQQSTRFLIIIAIAAILAGAAITTMAVAAWQLLRAA